MYENVRKTSRSRGCPGEWFGISFLDHLLEKRESGRTNSGTNAKKYLKEKYYFIMEKSYTEHGDNQTTKIYSERFFLVKSPKIRPKIFIFQFQIPIHDWSQESMLQNHWICQKNLSFSGLAGRMVRCLIFIPLAPEARIQQN